MRMTWKDKPCDRWIPYHFWWDSPCYRIAFRHLDTSDEKEVTTEMNKVWVLVRGDGLMTVKNETDRQRKKKRRDVEVPPLCNEMRWDAMRWDKIINKNSASTGMRRKVYRTYLIRNPRTLLCSSPWVPRRTSSPPDTTRSQRCADMGDGEKMRWRRRERRRERIGQRAR